MTCQELHELHPGEVQSPAAGEEQPPAPVSAEGHPAEKQLGRKGTGAPGGHQV